MGFTEAKEIYKRFQDKNGFIRKTPEDIADELTNDYDDNKEMTQLLYRCMYNCEIEFEDEEKEDAWRFKANS